MTTSEIRAHVDALANAVQARKDNGKFKEAEIFQKSHTAIETLLAREAEVLEWAKSIKGLVREEDEAKGVFYIYPTSQAYEQLNAILNPENET